MRCPGHFGALLLASMALLGGCQTRTSDKDIAKGSVIVSLTDVRQAMGGEGPSTLLIDPRAPKHYAEGHLPGARNLRLHHVREETPRDPELERYGRLVVYGDNPGSAVAKAMFKRLLAAGYSGVRFYPGGVAEWVRSGYALETSEPPAEEELGEVVSGR